MKEPDAALVDRRYGEARLCHGFLSALAAAGIAALAVLVFLGVEPGPGPGAPEVGPALTYTVCGMAAVVCCVAWFIFRRRLATESVDRLFETLVVIYSLYFCVAMMGVLAWVLAGETLLAFVLMGFSLYLLLLERPDRTRMLAWLRQGSVQRGQPGAARRLVILSDDVWVLVADPLVKLTGVAVVLGAAVVLFFFMLPLGLSLAQFLGFLCLALPFTLLASLDRAVFLDRANRTATRRWKLFCFQGSTAANLPDFTEVRAVMLTPEAMRRTPDAKFGVFLASPDSQYRLMLTSYEDEALQLGLEIAEFLGLDAPSGTMTN